MRVVRPEMARFQNQPAIIASGPGPTRRRRRSGAGTARRQRPARPGWAEHRTMRDSSGCSSVDRVLASEAKGRGFDPRQPHHLRIAPSCLRAVEVEPEILCARNMPPWRRGIRSAYAGRLRRPPVCAPAKAAQRRLTRRGIDVPGGFVAQVVQETSAVSAGGGIGIPTRYVPITSPSTISWRWMLSICLMDSTRPCATRRKSCRCRTVGILDADQETVATRCDRW
jgi:hypothetical protein